MIVNTETPRRIREAIVNARGLLDEYGACIELSRALYKLQEISSIIKWSSDMSNEGLSSEEALTKAIRLVKKSR